MKEATVCVQSLKQLFFITGNALSVCRGTWFTGSGAPELWQPIVEEDAEHFYLGGVLKETKTLVTFIDN